MNKTKSTLIGTAFAVVLSLGFASSASAFTFRRPHAYTQIASRVSPRIRKTTQYNHPRMRMKSYIHTHIQKRYYRVPAVPKVILPAFQQYTRPAAIRSRNTSRFATSGMKRVTLNQVNMPKFRSTTKPSSGVLAGRKVSKTRKVTKKRPVIRVKSPSKPVMVRVRPTVSATAAVAALWGSIIAD